MSKFKTYIIVITISLLLLPFYACAQNSNTVIGAWYGVADISGMKLRIVFNVKQSQDTLVATMDSPDQKISGIPVQSVQFEDSMLLIQIPSINFTFKGKLSTQQDSIKGQILQRMRLIPITLSRNEIEAARRPQDPVEPYPYRTVEVTFNSTLSEDLSFAGTLTLPERSDDKRPAAVVLVTGSGAQDRDESIMGHRPFLVLADYLTRNGIAVLRYDERGVGESSGDFESATTTDFADDVAAAIEYLKSRDDIDVSRIGIIGHSEGGIVASMVAAVDSSVGFVVLLASPGVSGRELLLMQNEAIGRASGLAEGILVGAKTMNGKLYDMVLAGESDSVIMQYMMSIPAMSEYKAKQAMEQLTSVWFRTFLGLNPTTYLELVTCPVLVLNGTKDLQVPYKENLSAIGKALARGGNKKFTLEELEGLNHLFQECSSGLPNEYASIEQTFSESALEKIKSWIIRMCGDKL